MFRPHYQVLITGVQSLKLENVVIVLTEVRSLGELLVAAVLDHPPPLQTVADSLALLTVEQSHPEIVFSTHPVLQSISTPAFIPHLADRVAPLLNTTKYQNISDFNEELKQIQPVFFCSRISHQPLSLITAFV